MNVLMFFLTATIGLMLQDQPENTNLITLTYQHGVKLDKIQEPGNSFVFKQFCTTKIDSVISSGNIIMKNSKIGLIKNCNYQWQIREDTLRTIIIETLKKKNTNQLLNQASAQFGTATHLIGDSNTTYAWTIENTRQSIHANLIINETGHTAILTVARYTTWKIMLFRGFLLDKQKSPTLKSKSRQFE
jgi:hypothetical protein